VRGQQRIKQDHSPGMFVKQVLGHYIDKETTNRA
jgi:hypothetical protein